MFFLTRHQQFTRGAHPLDEGRTDVRYVVELHRVRVAQRSLPTGMGSLLKECGGLATDRQIDIVSRADQLPNQPGAGIDRRSSPCDVARDTECGARRVHGKQFRLGSRVA